MTSHAALRNERGIALVVVLLVVLAIAAIAAGAALLGSSTSLISVFHTRMSVMEETADAGLEEARSMVNAAKTNYPDTGYKVLENGVAVYNAAGAVIPNIKRWTYVGPIGISTGQFGVFGSAVSVVQNAQGDRVIRRGEIFQESFAKYAYFTNSEGSIQFGSGDQIFGPVFTNDNISINSGGITFWGPVATHGTISGQKTLPTIFKQGYKENAPLIAFPQTADLTKLQVQATTGGTDITSTTGGAVGQATTRIEFVAVDLNNDGKLDGIDEGFMRVYQVTRTTPANYAWWVVADTGGTYGAYSAGGHQEIPELRSHIGRWSWRPHVLQDVRPSHAVRQLDCAGQRDVGPDARHQPPLLPGRVGDAERLDRHEERAPPRRHGDRCHVR